MLFLIMDCSFVGSLYFLLAFFSGILGFGFSLFLSLELFVPYSVMGDGIYYVVLTSHAVVMVFFFLTVLATGFYNFFIPGFMGCSDFFFPSLNFFSFVILIISFFFLVFSLFFGEGVSTGWTLYPPLSSKVFSFSNSVDLFMVSVHLFTFSSVVSSINLICTVFYYKKHSDSWLCLNSFVWSGLVTSFLNIFSLPYLTSAMTLLFFDSNFGCVFFDSSFGGDPILFQSLFWFWGHPEVYILMIPVFGLISLVIGSVLGSDLVFGDVCISVSIISVGVLGFFVWGHHMVTVGWSLDTKSFFMTATVVMSLPTGLKVFNWCCSLFFFKSFDTCYYSSYFSVLLFIFYFVVGGVTGIMLSNFSLDLILHDTYFVVGHFHYVLSLAAVSGYLSGLFEYWPSISGGYSFSSGLVLVFIFLFFISSNFMFFPFHFLGLSGCPSSVSCYSDGFFGWFYFSSLGFIGLFFCVFLLFFIFMSSMNFKHNSFFKEEISSIFGSFFVFSLDLCFCLDNNVVVNSYDYYSLLLMEVFFIFLFIFLVLYYYLVISGSGLSSNKKDKEYKGSFYNDTILHYVEHSENLSYKKKIEKYNKEEGGFWMLLCFAFYDFIYQVLFWWEKVKSVFFSFLSNQKVKKEFSFFEEKPMEISSCSGKFFVVGLILYFLLFYTGYFPLSVLSESWHFSGLVFEFFMEDGGVVDMIFGKFGFSFSFSISTSFLKIYSIFFKGFFVFYAFVIILFVFSYSNLLNLLFFFFESALFLFVYIFPEFKFYLDFGFFCFFFSLVFILSIFFVFYSNDLFKVSSFSFLYNSVFCFFVNTVWFFGFKSFIFYFYKLVFFRVLIFFILLFLFLFIFYFYRESSLYIYNKKIKGEMVNTKKIIMSSSKLFMKELEIIGNFKPRGFFYKTLVYMLSDSLSKEEKVFSFYFKKLVLFLIFVFVSCIFFSTVYLHFNFCLSIFVSIVGFCMYYYLLFYIISESMENSSENKSLISSGELKDVEGESDWCDSDWKGKVKYYWNSVIIPYWMVLAAWMMLTLLALGSDVININYYPPMFMNYCLFMMYSNIFFFAFCSFFSFFFMLYELMYGVKWSHEDSFLSFFSFCLSDFDIFFVWIFSIITSSNFWFNLKVFSYFIFLFKIIGVFIILFLKFIFLFFFFKEDNVSGFSFSEEKEIFSMKNLFIGFFILGFFIFYFLVFGFLYFLSFFNSFYLILLFLFFILVFGLLFFLEYYFSSDLFFYFFKCLVSFVKSLVLDLFKGFVDLVKCLSIMLKIFVLSFLKKIYNGLKKSSSFLLAIIFKLFWLIFSIFFIFLDLFLEAVLFSFSDNPVKLCVLFKKMFYFIFFILFIYDVVFLVFFCLSYSFEIFLFIPFLFVLFFFYKSSSKGGFEDAYSL